MYLFGFQKYICLSNVKFGVSPKLQKRNWGYLETGFREYVMMKSME
jgi:hypothetical protein